MRHIYILFTIFICILLAAGSAFAGIKGTIIGQVTEKDSGNILSQANIIVEGTKAWTSSGADGRFVIGNIPVGDYPVRVELLGYKTVITEPIKIIMDRTLEINFILEPEVVGAPKEVLVVAEAPLIEPDKTGSTYIVEGEVIDSMPLMENRFQDVMTTLPGVLAKPIFPGGSQQNNVRGGRPDEVNYYVNDFSILDPAFHTFGTNVNQNAIERLEIITGGFDAEYGNAMSGILNVVTKSGTDEWKGSLGVKGYFMSEALNGKDRDGKTINSDRTIGEFTIGGPISDKLRIFLSGEFSDAEEGSKIVMNEQADIEEHKILAKLSYLMSDNDTIELTVHSDYSEYHQIHPIIPKENNPTQEQESWIANLAWNHQFDNDTFLDTRLASYYSKIDLSVNGKKPEEYDPYIDDYLEFAPFYYSQGDWPEYEIRYARRYSIQQALTTRLSDVLQLKMGWEYGYENIFDDYRNDFNIISTYNFFDPFDPTVYTIDDPYGWTTGYVNKIDDDSSDAAAYIQAKWDVAEAVTVRPGLRVDWQEIIESTEVSPRLGVNYQLDNHTLLRANAGRFVQKVPLLWAGQDYAYQDNFYADGYEETFLEYVANDDLDMPSSMQYEAGFDRVICQSDKNGDLILHFTWFYKDYEDLLQDTIVDDSWAYLGTFQIQNIDEALARGIEVQLEKKMGECFSAYVGYTYSKVRGTGTEVIGIDQSDYYGLDGTRSSEYDLDWDQRNTWDAGVYVMLPAEWQLNVIYSYGDGFPYTRLDRETGQAFTDDDGNPIFNNGRVGSTMSLDASISKLFDLGDDVSFQITLEGFNITDHENVVSVDQFTGEVDQVGPERRIQIGGLFEF